MTKLTEAATPIGVGELLVPLFVRMHTPPSAGHNLVLGHKVVYLQREKLNLMLLWLGLLAPSFNRPYVRIIFFFFRARNETDEAEGGLSGQQISKIVFFVPCTVPWSCTWHSCWAFCSFVKDVLAISSNLSSAMALALSQRGTAHWHQTRDPHPLVALMFLKLVADTFKPLLVVVSHLDGTGFQEVNGLELSLTSKGCDPLIPPEPHESSFACKRDVQVPNWNLLMLTFGQNSSAYEFYYIAAYQWNGNGWVLDTTSSVFGDRKGGLINNLPGFQKLKVGEGSCENLCCR